MITGGARMKNEPKKIDKCFVYHFEFLGFEFVRFSYFSNEIRPFWVTQTGEMLDENMVYDLKKNRYYSGGQLRTALETRFDNWINKKVQE